MQRRKFVKSSIIGAAATSAGFTAYKPSNDQSKREVYELRRYEMIRNYRKNDLDRYFREALIPALNRLGVKNVGCFTPLGKAEPVVVYLLIPYPSGEDYFRIINALPGDETFRKASEFYDKQPADNPVFNRMESSLLQAFEGFPVLRVPGEKKKLFEIRTYEGYNEDAVRRKVDMFNDGEIGIFLNNGFTPVFYSKDLVGARLPCLTYMLAFDNMDERDEKWKAFGSDPEWKRMSSDPAYADTVSKIFKTFLEPLPYSQV